MFAHSEIRLPMHYFECIMVIQVSVFKFKIYLNAARTVIDSNFDWQNEMFCVLCQRCAAAYGGLDLTLNLYLEPPNFTKSLLLWCFVCVWVWSWPVKSFNYFIAASERRANIEFSLFRRTCAQLVIGLFDMVRSHLIKERSLKTFCYVFLWLNGTVAPSGGHREAQPHVVMR